MQKQIPRVTLHRAAVSSYPSCTGDPSSAAEHVLVFPLRLGQLRAPTCSAEGGSPIPQETLRLAAAEGLKAAAIKARMEASYAERDVVRFACSAIDLQMKRIELKLKQADQLEALLQQQRLSLEVRGAPSLRSCWEQSGSSRRHQRLHASDPGHPAALGSHAC